MKNQYSAEEETVVEDVEAIAEKLKKAKKIKE
jgi:hypothetical protein